MVNIVKVFFDVETTGTNPNRHSIHQLSGIIEINDKAVETFNFDVRPHERAEFDPYAVQMSNKTIEQMKNSMDMHKVQKVFVAMLSKYIDRFNSKEKAYLVGFNNRAFDDIFLRKFFELCGDSFFGSWFWSHSLDAMVLASEYLIDRRPQMSSFKLKRVATEVGILVDHEKLHDALYDVELTREVYRIVTGKQIEL